MRCPFLRFSCYNAVMFGNSIDKNQKYSIMYIRINVTIRNIIREVFV